MLVNAVMKVESTDNNFFNFRILSHVEAKEKCFYSLNTIVVRRREKKKNNFDDTIENENNSIQMR